MTLYLWEREGNKISRDNCRGVLKSVPAVPADVYFCAFGDPAQTYAFSSERGQLMQDFSAQILPLVSESVFELTELYEELEYTNDRIEMTDYIPEGIHHGTLKAEDYAGILADRDRWIAERERIKSRIKELES